MSKAISQQISTTGSQRGHGTPSSVTSSSSWSSSSSDIRDIAKENLLLGELADGHVRVSQFNIQTADSNVIKARALMYKNFVQWASDRAATNGYKTYVSDSVNCFVI